LLAEMVGKDSPLQEGILQLVCLIIYGGIFIYNIIGNAYCPLLLVMELHKKKLNFTY
jgi:hypothetical protein